MKLINELSHHLKDMEVDWHLCGGFAIDTYLGEKTRKHKDLDITVSFDYMRECISYLQERGWTIDAPVGNGRLISVERAIERSDLNFDNLWCYKENNSFMKIEKISGEFKYVSFLDREQTELDFIEVLFNKVEDNIFYYQKNQNITLPTNKAFIKKGDISILAPEIILLYKSRNTKSEDYKNDFILTLNKLDREAYSWLINAMNIEYPQGHPWL